MASNAFSAQLDELTQQEYDAIMATSTYKSAPAPNQSLILENLTDDLVSRSPTRTRELLEFGATKKYQQRIADIHRKWETKTQPHIQEPTGIPDIVNLSTFGQVAPEPTIYDNYFNQRVREGSFGDSDLDKELGDAQRSYELDIKNAVGEFEPVKIGEKYALVRPKPTARTDKRQSLEAYTPGGIVEVSGSREELERSIPKEAEVSADSYLGFVLNEIDKNSTLKGEFFAKLNPKQQKLATRYALNVISRKAKVSASPALLKEQSNLKKVLNQLQIQETLRSEESGRPGPKGLWQAANFAADRGLRQFMATDELLSLRGVTNKYKEKLADYENNLYGWNVVDEKLKIEVDELERELEYQAKSWLAQQGEISRVGSSAQLQDFAQEFPKAKGFWAKAAVLQRDFPYLMFDAGIESMMTQLPVTLLSVYLGGRGGLNPLSVGAMSALSENIWGYDQALRSAMSTYGYDPNDSQSYVEGLKDYRVVTDANEVNRTRSTIIGSSNAAFFALFKPFTNVIDRALIMGGAQKAMSTTVAGVVATNVAGVVYEPVTEGLSELGAQVGSGQKVNFADVILESFGSPTGLGELSTLARNKANPLLLDAVQAHKLFEGVPEESAVSAETLAFINSAPTVEEVKALVNEDGTVDQAKIRTVAQNIINRQSAEPKKQLWEAKEVSGTPDVDFSIGSQTVRVHRGVGSLLGKAANRFERAGNLANVVKRGKDSLTFFRQGQLFEINRESTGDDFDSIVEQIDSESKRLNSIRGAESFEGVPVYEKLRKGFEEFIRQNSLSDASAKNKSILTNDSVNLGLQALFNMDKVLADRLSIRYNLPVFAEDIAETRVAGAKSRIGFTSLFTTKTGSYTYSTNSLEFLGNADLTTFFEEFDHQTLDLFGNLLLAPSEQQKLADLLKSEAVRIGESGGQNAVTGLLKKAGTQPRTAEGAWTNVAQETFANLMLGFRQEANDIEGLSPEIKRILAKAAVFQSEVFNEIGDQRFTALTPEGIDFFKNFFQVPPQMMQEFFSEGNVADRVLKQNEVTMVDADQIANDLIEGNEITGEAIQKAANGPIPLDINELRDVLGKEAQTGPTIANKVAEPSPPKQGEPVVEPGAPVLRMPRNMLLPTDTKVEGELPKNLITRYNKGSIYTTETALEPNPYLIFLRWVGAGLNSEQVRYTVSRLRDLRNKFRDDKNERAFQAEVQKHLQNVKEGLPKEVVEVVDEDRVTDPVDETEYTSLVISGKWVYFPQEGTFYQYDSGRYVNDSTSNYLAPSQVQDAVRTGSAYYIRNSQIGVVQSRLFGRERSRNLFVLKGDEGRKRQFLKTVRMFGPAAISKTDVVVRLDTGDVYAPNFETGEVSLLSETWRKNKGKEERRFKIEKKSDLYEGIEDLKFSVEMGQAFVVNKSRYAKAKEMAEGLSADYFTLPSVDTKLQQENVTDTIIDPEIGIVSLYLNEVQQAEVEEVARNSFDVVEGEATPEVTQEIREKALRKWLADQGVLTREGKLGPNANNDFSRVIVASDPTLSAQSELEEFYEQYKEQIGLPLRSDTLFQDRRQTGMSQKMYPGASQGLGKLIRDNRYTQLPNEEVVRVVNERLNSFDTVFGALQDWSRLVGMSNQKLNREFNFAEEYDEGGQAARVAYGQAIIGELEKMLKQFETGIGDLPNGMTSDKLININEALVAAVEREHRGAGRVGSITKHFYHYSEDFQINQIKLKRANQDNAFWELLEKTRKISRDYQAKNKVSGTPSDEVIKGLMQDEGMNPLFVNFVKKYWQRRLVGKNFLQDAFNAFKEAKLLDDLPPEKEAAMRKAAQLVNSTQDKAQKEVAASMFNLLVASEMGIPVSDAIVGGMINTLLATSSVLASNIEGGTSTNVINYWFSLAALYRNNKSLTGSRGKAFNITMLAQWEGLKDSLLSKQAQKFALIKFGDVAHGGTGRTNERLAKTTGWVGSLMPLMLGSVDKKDTAQDVVLRAGATLVNDLGRRVATAPDAYYVALAHEAFLSRSLYSKASIDWDLMSAEARTKTGKSKSQYIQDYIDDQLGVPTYEAEYKRAEKFVFDNRQLFEATSIRLNRHSDKAMRQAAEVLAYNQIMNARQERLKDLMDKSSKYAYTNAYANELGPIATGIENTINTILDLGKDGGVMAKWDKKGPTRYKFGPINLLLRPGTVSPLRVFQPFVSTILRLATSMGDYMLFPATIKLGIMAAEKRDIQKDKNLKPEQREKELYDLQDRKTELLLKAGIGMAGAVIFFAKLNASPDDEDEQFGLSGSQGITYKERYAGKGVVPPYSIWWRWDNSIVSMSYKNMPQAMAMWGLPASVHEELQNNPKYAKAYKDNSFAAGMIMASAWAGNSLAMMDEAAPVEGIVSMLSVLLQRETGTSPASILSKMTQLAKPLFVPLSSGQREIAQTYRNYFGDKSVPIVNKDDFLAQIAVDTLMWPVAKAVTGGKVEQSVGSRVNWAGERGSDRVLPVWSSLEVRPHSKGLGFLVSNDLRIPKVPSKVAYFTLVPKEFRAEVLANSENAKNGSFYVEHFDEAEMKAMPVYMKWITEYSEDKERRQELRDFAEGKVNELNMNAGEAAYTYHQLAQKDITTIVNQARKIANLEIARDYYAKDAGAKDILDTFAEKAKRKGYDLSAQDDYLNE